ncbi:serpin B9-like [Tropilaelaps mercedesae]|uniref:Serpin B9-like n=1 Tax=Tropilaelaps mercedesae TaxID=418985 RepID=A0A1V9XVB4_9ACAR|nr:serpin B9-like [Tropilaelaps mercedesae]
MISKERIDSLMFKDEALEFNDHTQTDLIGGMGKFGYSLLTESQTSGKQPKNVLVSPFAVYSILLTLLAGAKGDTKKELEKALAVNGSWKTFIGSGDYLHNVLERNKSSLTVDIANRIYISTELQVPQLFTDSATFGFGSNVALVDFKKNNKVMAAINDFVNRVTHGRISKVVSEPLEKETSVAIISALFFQGAWRNVAQNVYQTIKFNAGCNSLEKAHSKWAKISGKIGYIKSSSVRAQLFRIPYDTGENSLIDVDMVIAVPSTNHCDIRLWLGKVDWFTLMKAIGSMQTIEVDLLVPEFEMEWDTDLQKPLKGLGIVEAFDMDRADFSDMARPTMELPVSSGVYLSALFHHTKLILSTNGTEARLDNLSPRRKKRQAEAMDLKVTSSFYFAVVTSEPVASSPKRTGELQFMQLFTGTVVML